MRISDWSSDVCSSDLAQLLDAADGLEARLRDARAEIEAIAGSNDNPVREAMQEMLRQRLWLQQHGDGASLEQLRAVRASIEDARRRIDRHLVPVERARAPQPCSPWPRPRPRPTAANCPRARERVREGKRLFARVHT